MKKILTLALFISIFFATPKLALATTYYTSTSGSDNNSGSSSSPFKTINHGIGVLHAGDTLLVKTGTYSEQLPDSITSGTSWTNAVTIKANPGDIVTIKPPSGALRAVTFSNGEKYIIIDGFIIDAANVSSDAIKLQANDGMPSANHIRIANSEIKNALNQGILVGAPTAPAISGDFNEFINLKVHDNGRNDDFHIHGLYIATNNNLVDGGEYYNNSSHGIQIDSCHTNYGNNNIFRNLKIHNNGPRSSRPEFGAGIGIYCGNNNLIYNVVAWANGANFRADYAATNTKFFNDTGYQNYSSTFGNFFVGSQASGTVIKNSIGYQGTGSNFANQSGSTTTQNNLFGVNPLFIDASTFNFALQSSSPAINAGVTLPEVTTDILGVTRPVGGAYDIGAYEFGGTVNPTASPTAAPTSDINGDGIIDGVDYVLCLKDSACNLNMLINDLRAGRGNRTLAKRLEISCSTIKPYPLIL